MQSSYPNKMMVSPPGSSDAPDSVPPAPAPLTVGHDAEGPYLKFTDDGPKWRPAGREAGDSSPFVDYQGLAWRVPGV